MRKVFHGTAFAIEQLQGVSITWRIAVGPQQGRKVFTRQTLPPSKEPFDDGFGQLAGLSLHAGVAAGKAVSNCSNGVAGVG